jgi:peptidoglycan/LPS O-acetylase OafA/YrhL
VIAAAVIWLCLGVWFLLGVLGVLLAIRRWGPLPSPEFSLCFVLGPAMLLVAALMRPPAQEDDDWRDWGP